MGAVALQPLHSSPVSAEYETVHAHLTLLTILRGGKRGRRWPGCTKSRLLNTTSASLASKDEKVSHRPKPVHKAGLVTHYLHLPVIQPSPISHPPPPPPHPPPPPPPHHILQHTHPSLLVATVHFRRISGWQLR